MGSVGKPGEELRTQRSYAQPMQTNAVNATFGSLWRTDRVPPKRIVMFWALTVVPKFVTQRTSISAWWAFFADQYLQNVFSHSEKSRRHSRRSPGFIKQMKTPWFRGTWHIHSWFRRYCIHHPENPFCPIFASGTKPPLCSAAVRQCTSEHWCWPAWLPALFQPVLNGRANDIEFDGDDSQFFYFFFIFFATRGFLQSLAQLCKKSHFPITPPWLR